MFWPRSLSLVLSGIFAATAISSAQLQTPSEPARVTVSLNADGSRTTYAFDTATRTTLATTTSKEGKTTGKIRYKINEAGRFESGEVLGADDKLRFRTLYKYDESGRLLEEKQLASDGSLQGRIVYSYDKSGKQVGYSTFDGTGNLIAKQAAPAAANPAKKSAGGK